MEKKETQGNTNPIRNYLKVGHYELIPQAIHQSTKTKKKEKQEEHLQKKEILFTWGL